MFRTSAYLGTRPCDVVATSSIPGARVRRTVFVDTSVETANDPTRLCRNPVDVEATISTRQRIPGVLGWGNEVADARAHEAVVLATGVVVGIDVYASVDFVLVRPRTG